MSMNSQKFQRKGKLKNMGYFHALKWAFLSSLTRKWYMLWEGFYHDFSTKKVSASGGFAPWPPQGALPPGPPAGGAAPSTPEATPLPLTIYPGATPDRPCSARATLSLWKKEICTYQHILTNNLKLYPFLFVALHPVLYVCVCVGGGKRCFGAEALVLGAVIPSQLKRSYTEDWVQDRCNLLCKFS